MSLHMALFLQSASYLYYTILIAILPIIEPVNQKVLYDVRNAVMLYSHKLHQGLRSCAMPLFQISMPTSRPGM